MNYAEKYPLTRPRDIVGEPCEPVWHACETPPRREMAARLALREVGQDGFYPEIERMHRRNGKEYRRKYPIVTRVILAHFTRYPMWHNLKNRQLISRVFSHNGWPISIGPEVIKNMRGMPTEAERLVKEQLELSSLHQGDKAEITEGPLSGMLVEVESTSQGRALWRTLTGVRGQSDVRVLEKKT